MSLLRIALRDFVLVTQLELELELGFTVLTGETGAGKSILIDALQLALGARADAGVIREGAARTEVSLEFELTDPLASWLEEAGFERADTVMLRRQVDTQGKSRGWINGSPATAAQLREVGELTVDIHGQHAWQSLTRADSVRGLLDAYGSIHLEGLKGAWQRWRQARQELEQARSLQAGLQAQRERLQWQISELEKLSPGENEWDELNTSHTRLAHAQALLEATQLGLTALEEDEQGAISRVARAQEALLASAHLEPEFVPLSEVLASVLAQAQDAVHSLRAYQRRADLDPARLAELDARMVNWMSLARRFKTAPQDLAALLKSWRTELAQLEAAADLQALEQSEVKAQADYRGAALVVSRARAQAAPKLAQAVSAAMQELGMQGGQFAVHLQALDQPESSGLEQVEFLVCGHPGGSLRPVGKVASGGELSRIALAIAVTTSQLGSAQTLIFDEVDAGVGGAVAQTVGRLMSQLGRDRQVLAVTHLPQVAAFADHHLLVSKQLVHAATTSTVRVVQDEHRVSEIARMLGGQHLSETTTAHAREMLALRR